MHKDIQLDKIVCRDRDRERMRDRKTGTQRVGEKGAVRWRDSLTARKRAREISIGKNIEYKKEKIFYMHVLKTIHKKIRNQKMKSKERDKSILEYVQCMYNNVHTYQVPGF